MTSYNFTTKKCQGCGVKLTNQQLTIGYTPKKISTVLWCMSCYQIKHYNKPSTLIPQPINNLKQVFSQLNWNNSAAANQWLLIVVVDLVSLGFANQLLKEYHGKEILLVINKIDLIPFQVKSKIEQYWTNQLRKHHLKFTIHFTSAKNKVGINYLTKIIHNYQQIAFVGCSGAGKSSLIKIISQKLGLVVNNLVSGFLNTTCEIISTKVGQSKIFDTPGIRRLSGYFQYLSPKNIYQIQNSKWKIKNFQFHDNQVYFFDQYGWLQISGMPTINGKLIFYGPNLLRWKKKKGQNFSYPQNLSSWLLTNNHQKISWINHQYKIREKTWFVIDDLGLIVIATNQQLNLNFYLPTNIQITMIN